MAYSDRIKKILDKINFHPNEIKKHSDEYFEKAKRNCENMIGTVSVPVGVAGPLKIQGDYVHREVVVPLATTEGCLVASVNRGCKAITLSGGADIQVQKVGITRAPVFRVSSADEGKIFVQYIKDHFGLFKKEIKKTSRYLELIEVKIKRVGRNVYVKFFFDSKDAMGMNMAVIACDHLVRKVIEAKTKAECVSLSSNYCTDKKPSFVNFIEGRGFTANAEATIPRDIVEKLLKVSPEKIFEVYSSKIVVGSALSGSLGFNAHFANIIAAIFIATGQDAAHTVEGSNGITTVELTKNKDFYINVYLPSILCGVTGGGTTLPKQKEALQLLGIEINNENIGEANFAFAEIIAGTVLAGEISLLSALAGRDLARSHRERCRK